VQTPTNQRLHLDAFAQMDSPKPAPGGWPDAGGLPVTFTPECPRCGYDVSGQATLARQQSPRPTTGTCSECGLAFEWRLVLNPSLAGWLWFIESTGRRLHRACFITTWRALYPPRFWQDVRLETKVVPSRIARWAITTFGVLFLALSILVIAQAVAFATVGTRTAILTPMTTPGTPGNPTTTIWSAPTGMNPANLGSLTLQGVIDAARHDLNATWGGRRGIPPRGAASLLWALGATMMAPLVVFALPHTRARAKVRSLHVFRAAAYSFSWLVALCVWSIALRSVELVLTVSDILSNANPSQFGWGFTMRRLPFSAMSGGFGVIAALVIAAWFVLHWSMVLARGWRMQTADAVPAALSIFACSSLAGLAFMLYVGDLF
jgi:hypothetical protein